MAEKEYIEREVAIKAIEKYGTGNGSALGHHSGAVDCAICEIEAIPAADVAPVVRCKYCDKSEPSNVWDGWIFCRANKVHQKDDNFCSYGERKGGEG